MELTQLADETFEQTIAAAKVPVMINQGAEWCGPRRALEPTMRQVTEDFDGRLVDYKMDFN